MRAAECSRFRAENAEVTRRTEQAGEVGVNEAVKQDLQIEAHGADGPGDAKLSGGMAPDAAPELTVALLTGGADRPYVFGLGTSLMREVAGLDVIGSDDLDFPEFRSQPSVSFLNLRGSHRTDVNALKKVFRILMYYARLIRYAATAKPKIFHILWNNKIEIFDRTLLMLYYRFLGKKIVRTVHNVNAGKRDLNDSSLNRLTLRIQYRLTRHLFVHTEQMKRELTEEFGVEGRRVTVIPFGINNAVPNTALTPPDAKRHLGIPDGSKTILFFGNITPYKGLEYLIAAFHQLQASGEDYRLIIAGKPDNCEEYWSEVRESVAEDVRRGQVLLKASFIPDRDTEIYFKAADVLVLPYRHVYQSGVLFLGQSFGLPVIAADVGSLKDEIVEGETGFIFTPEDSADLAKTIERYFASDLFAELDRRRPAIRDDAAKNHSWEVVAKMTAAVYADLLRVPYAGRMPDRDVSSASADVNAPS